MQPIDKEQNARFHAMLGESRARQAAGFRLKEIARSLHRLNEEACNYGLTPRQEKRQDNLETEAGELARECGFATAYNQGDPRGGPLYLLDEEQAKDPAALYSQGEYVPF